MSNSTQNKVFNDLPAKDQKEIIRGAMDHAKKLQDEVLTQNDWENELLQALILDQPPVEVIFIKGEENLVRTCTWSQFVAVVDKFRADARKEAIDKAIDLIKRLKLTKLPYDEIYELATLRKEQV